MFDLTDPQSQAKIFIFLRDSGRIRVTITRRDVHPQRLKLERPCCAQPLGECVIISHTPP